MATIDFVFHALLRLHFLSFLAKCIQTVEPGTNYRENWHVLALAFRLERVRRGEIRRLMINLPPRSLKTHIVSIAWTAWILGHDPTRRIICITYSNDVAKTQAKLFSKIVQSAWYRRAFPECRADLPNKLMDWHTTKGGYRLAASVEGSVLSRGADYIVIDDPNKGQEIYSKVMREKVKTAYDHVISTRLNNPKESAIICVMQRLHPDDLAGHILSQEEWDEVVMPAVATEDELWDLGNGEQFLRPKGELLQSFHVGHEELAVKRRNMGLMMYEAQYQQRPIPDEGAVIKRRWLKFYDTPPENIEFRLASWDAASTLGENSDWSVGTVWGVAEGNYYLLHIERDRLETPDLRHRIEQIHREFGTDVTLIEDEGVGRSVVQDLRRTSPWCTPLLVPVRFEKLARMQGRAVMFETGRVFLPRAAEWLACYLDELLAFPNSVKDDQIDSTSQALDYLQQRFSAPLRYRPEGRMRPSGGPRPPGTSRKTA